MKLAFALRATPGGYAVLLGAGASIAAGMPSAWDVQQDLIERLAAAEGATEIGDPHTWYEQRFGRPATYDDLLEALTSTPFDRQALLRTYFEPDEQEREEGRKQPTAAHHGIACLVAAGHIRVVLTTNFDRLVETALREAGIEPTVVSGPDDITGLAPLHTLNCLVVHLHGDYLDPTNMRNTPKELRQYGTSTNRLLNRIFTEYGLVISGWSAQWDPALRRALSRCRARIFASYWTDPRQLPEQAQDIVKRRGATYVQADADTFFVQVADAVDALADTERQHPASIAIAVAAAKRALSGAHQAIPLHDSLRREVSRIAALPMRTTGPWGGYTDTDAEHERRLGHLEAETELLLALVATTAYWGSDETDRWWMRDIEQLGTLAHASGATILINLAGAPGTMAIYAAGIAALSAERWRTVVRVLTEPQAQNPSNGKVLPAAALLGPQYTIGIHGASERIHAQLRPVFTEHLSLSERAYLEAWEHFEYLRLLAQQDAGRGFDWPHIRRAGTSDNYRASPMDWLRQELDQHGSSHPLVREKFLGGDGARLLRAKEATDANYDRWATHLRLT